MSTYSREEKNDYNKMLAMRKAQERINERRKVLGIVL